MLIFIVIHIFLATRAARLPPFRRLHLLLVPTARLAAGPCMQHDYRLSRLGWWRGLGNHVWALSLETVTSTSTSITTPHLATLFNTPCASNNQQSSPHQTPQHASICLVNLQHTTLRNTPHSSTPNREVLPAGAHRRRGMRTGQAAKAFPPRD